MRHMQLKRGPSSRPAHVGTPVPVGVQRCSLLVARAKNSTQERPEPALQERLGKMADKLGGLGDALGPIGLTIGADIKLEHKPKAKPAADVTNRSGVALGPISLSFGGDDSGDRASSGLDASSSDSEQHEAPKSIHSMSTAEWRALYEKDGAVDLWMEDEFNAGSRLVGGRAVHKGGVYGYRTGEGVSAGDAAVHKVKIRDHFGNQDIEVEVPEDRYVLWEAEDKGLELPYACRMGCCTACAVRVKEGEMYQPEALGISPELREAGYALMCVGFPKTDLVLETVSEDEIYELQFGRYFEEQALDPDQPSIERDDFALSIANMDE